MKQTPGYTVLEHTADAGLIAWGRDPAAAFSEAARGMFALILGHDPLEVASHAQPEALPVEARGDEWDDLLVNWLAEVLFYFDTEGLVAQEIDFSGCAPPACKALLHCVRLHGSSELGGVGVKAITYHQLYVRVGVDYTELRVIFDI